MAVATAFAGNQPEFEFEAGSHKAGDLAVYEFKVEEEISKPYSAEITLVARQGVDVDTDSILNKDALLSVCLGQGVLRFVHGIVASIDRWEAGEGPDSHRFVARIAPRFWKLGHCRKCRIFQEMTVPDIVKKVLGEGQVDFRSSLSGSYSKRGYCVQYRESDLDFVSRLLEEEGIFYFFEHDQSKHTMVLADAASSSPKLPGGERIIFRERSGMLTEEHVDSFLQRREVRSSAVALRDFDFKRPDADLDAKEEEGGEDLEVYDYPGRYEDLGTGKAISKARLEALRVCADIASGSSISRRLAPGHVFELAEHPLDAFNGEYLILSVTHRGWQPEALLHSEAFATGGGETLALEQGRHEAPDSKRHRYRNDFVCLRKGIAFRPEGRTKPPVIPGPQTATVVGPSSEEVFTDEHGRIKVQFHWDREGKKDEKSSCWVRVSQAWAGPGWGALYLPRIGHEVVVEFLEGNPDRPLVTGSVYNGQNPPPISLPSDKTKSTICSASSPGGGGSNELRFEDAAGSEEIYLHAQKDLKIVVENDKKQHVGGKETLTVDKNRDRSVGGSQSLLVEKDDTSTIRQNQALEVGKDRSTIVGGNHTETIGGDQSVHVGAASTLNVTLAATETVGLAKVLNVGGAYAVNVGAAMNELVGGLKSEEVAGAKTELIGAKKSEVVAGSRTLKVRGDLTETIDKSRTLKVGKDLTITVDGALQHVAASHYQLKSKEIAVTAEEKFLLKVGQATLEVKSSGDVVINGVKIQVSASGNLTLKGCEINEN